MRNQETGIISYAGLDKAALFRQAKQFYQQDNGTDRFSAFMPLFPVELVQNMRYIGKGGSLSAFVSRNGFSIDQSEYHRQLYDEMPDLYAGDNYRRNFDYDGHFVGRGVMTVDQVWADHFPQYEPFMGERLVLYMIGGGGQAVAVPESIYPRGCGVLHSAEMDMRICARGDHYAAYVKQRVDAGEDYDAELFGREYLRQFMLAPVTVSQKELGRIMQDMSLVRSLQEDEPVEPGRFSEYARRGENLPQYMPYHVACDTFERMPVTRSTARLMQLYYTGDEHISDLWFSYQEAGEYIDRQNMTLDVRALCQGYQIPPRYAMEARCGKYPDQVRIVTVQDRSLQPMVANTINNPAYGSGMNPLGMINKLIFLEDSAELLRTDRLSLENSAFVCENLFVSERDYVCMLEKASNQENKGQLIDTMYRREAVLTQLREGSDAYRKARAVLDKKMALHQEMVKTAAARSDRAQLSGYDADIDYLHRLEMSRLPEDDEENPQPIQFAPDALRMLSIESGFTMRSQIKRCSYGDIALPASELDSDEGYLFTRDEEPAAAELETVIPEEQDQEAAEKTSEIQENVCPEKTEEESASLQDEEPAEEVVCNEEILSPEDEGAETAQSAESVETDEAEETSETVEEDQLSAMERLEALMQEKTDAKPGKSLWSRALPKVEQLSLFENAAQENPAALSMAETLKKPADARQEEPSLMARLIEKNKEEQ
ncbi:MAG: hypothetical protein E7331_01690 [Clostridiales bacterium]|nr:hypothetical protein [Clostridiales bacterium]